MVADGSEGWVFHILPALDSVPELGAIWAAQRVPDDSVTVLANMFTIRKARTSLRFFDPSS